MVTEGIAGFASSGISVAALFKTCIESFNLATAARDFGQDEELLYTELYIQALRFVLWGEAVGLASREPNKQPRPDHALGNPQVQHDITRTLHAIKDLLGEIRVLKDKNSCKPEGSGSRSVSRGLGMFKATFDQFKEQGRRNQKQKTVAAVTKWTISDAKSFGVKITRLTQFIYGLQSTTASLVTVQAQQDHLRQDTESLSNVEIIRFLRDLSYPALDEDTFLPIPVPNYVPSEPQSKPRTSRFNFLKLSKSTSTKQSQSTTRASETYENQNQKNFPPSANNKLMTTNIISYNLVVLGSRQDHGRCGTFSALTTQFMTYDIPSYDEDSERYYIKQVMVDGVACRLELLDNFTLDEYTALRDHCLKEGEGFVLVYDINDRASFAKVQIIHDHILRVKESTPSDLRSQPMVMLVGRHYLENENQELQTFNRDISLQEGHKLARDLGCGFVETSSEDHIKIEKAFYEVVRALRKQRLYDIVSISE